MDTTDTRATKALYYRFTDAMLNDPRALDALLTPAFVDHSLPPGTPPGPEGLCRFRIMVNGALSDQRTRVEDVIAEGDKVVGRVRIVGTHTGPMLGVAPTGRPVDIEAIEIVRVEGGRVAERWNQRDGIGLLQQLGVYPPAPRADRHLPDDLGLLGMLRELVALHHADQSPGAAGPGMTIKAPTVLPPLPAAVEMAAYRIVQEAVANVVRHAHARRCHVRVAIDEVLTLVVVDDGVGLPAVPRAGVGLGAMREWAAEVGGTCTTEALPCGGTRVLARLPLRIAVETERPHRRARQDQQEE